MTFDLSVLPPDACLDWLGFRIDHETVDRIWRDPARCLALSKVDPARLDLSSGSVHVDDLRGASEWLGDLCYSEKSSPGPILKGFRRDKNPFYPLPESLTLVIHPHQPGFWYDYIGYDPKSVGDLYVTQNTFHGPTAPEELRPSVAIIYGRKGD